MLPASWPSFRSLGLLRGFWCVLMAVLLHFAAAGSENARRSTALGNARLFIGRTALVPLAARGMGRLERAEAEAEAARVNLRAWGQRWVEIASSENERR